MLMGAAPFVWIDGEPHYDMPPTDLYRNILNPNYAFYMPDALSANVIDLVRGLLAWQPLRRMGCLTDGAADVKTHPFFTVECRIDWNMLHSGALEPPQTPQLSGPEDVSQFDDPMDSPDFLVEERYQPDPDAWDAHF